jgi:hypothetical protein
VKGGAFVGPGKSTIRYGKVKRSFLNRQQEKKSRKLGGSKRRQRSYGESKRTKDGVINEREPRYLL